MTRAFVFLLLRLLIAAAAVGLFLLLAPQVSEKQENVLTDFDRIVSEDMAEVRLHVPLLSILFFALTLLAALQTMFVLVPLGAILLWSSKQRHAAVILLLCGSAAGTSNYLLKHHYQRERPKEMLRYSRVWENNESFPSGHSSSSMAVFGLLGYLSWRSARTPSRRFWSVVGFGLLILLIGFSRSFLCAHYVTDVIGGYLLGLAWLMLSISAVSALVGPASRAGPESAAAPLSSRAIPGG